MDDFLFKGNRLYVSRTSLWEKVIKELLGGMLGGHFGGDKTLASVEERYYWSQLGKDMVTIVKNYPLCQVYKGQA